MAGFNSKESFGDIGEDVGSLHTEHKTEFDTEVLLEDLTPNELAPIIRDVTREQMIEFETEFKRFMVTLPYGQLIVRASDVTANWNEDAPQKEFYFELQVPHIRLNEGNIINELQQRFLRCKIYTNNSAELCIGSLQSLRYGVSAEQFEYLFAEFLNEAIMISDSNEFFKDSPAQANSH